MANPFDFINNSTSPWLRMFGLGTDAQTLQNRQIGGARADMMAKMGEMIQAGVPIANIPGKMLNEPVFKNGVAMDPNIGAHMTAMISELQKQARGPDPFALSPGQVGLQPDPNNPQGPWKQVASAPTADIQTWTGVAGMSGQAQADISRAIWLIKSGNMTEAETAFYGPGGLVPTGKVSREFAQKTLGKVIREVDQRDATGAVIGKTLVDSSTGLPVSNISPPGNAPIGPAPVGQSGTQPVSPQAPQPPQAQPPPQDTGQPLTQVQPPPGPVVVPQNIQQQNIQGNMDLPGGYSPERAQTAIGINETGGRSNPYGTVGVISVNKRTGLNDRPLGRYGVMTSNLPSWSKEVFGRVMSPREFLNNPDAQDQLFQTKFEQNVAKYGNVRDAASVWFTGKPYAQGLNAKDVLGTSGHAYVDKFMANYSGAAPTQAQAPANSVATAVAQPAQSGSVATQPAGTTSSPAVLSNPADAFNGAGWLSLGKELFGNLAHATFPNNPSFGAGPQGTERDALRTLQTNIAGLGTNSKVSNTELKYYMNQMSGLGITSSPGGSLTGALEFRHFLEEKRALAASELNDPRQPVEVKKIAATDIQSFDYVLNSMPSIEVMNRKLQDINLGKGGGFGLGDAIGQVIGTAGNLLSSIRGDVSKGVAKGVKAVQNANDRSAAISTMSYEELKGLTNANPPLTDNENMAAAARLRQVRPGGQ